MNTLQATLIFNPHAGFGEWSSGVAQVARFWQEYGWRVALQPTRYAGHATELARAAVLAGHGLVLAAGGDGTLNEVANGLVHSDTVLAPLPVGTANSFAKELGLPRPNLLNPAWLNDASQALISGRVQSVDVGLCDGRHWLLWAGVGVDSFIVTEIEPRSRLFKRLGRFGYGVKALMTVPRFRGMRAKVTVDSQQSDGDFLLVTASNCRLFAGGTLPLNQAAALDDGQFEVWLLHGRQWPSLLRHTLEITLQQHLHSGNATVMRGRTLQIETHPRMPYHLDGEPAGNSPFACEVLPGALRLLAPSTTPPDLFIHPGEPLA